MAGGGHAVAALSCARSRTSHNIIIPSSSRWWDTTYHKLLSLQSIVVRMQSPVAGSHISSVLREGGQQTCKFAPFNHREARGPCGEWVSQEATA